MGPVRGNVGKKNRVKVPGEMFMEKICQGGLFLKKPPP
jgi:hypothetical protein